MMRTTLVLGLLLASTAVAQAGQHKYIGVHPVSAKADDGLCYIEAPHVHVYAPARAKVLYRVVDDHHHFVGDPVAYHYDGPKHPYYGHHPIEITVESPHTEYCYLDGAHFHGFEPAAEATFKLHAGAHWYIGPFDAHYTTHRKQYIRINKVVARVEYERPVVEFDAPPIGYMGPIVDVHVATPVLGVEVHTPSVEVVIPRPTLEVSVGFGAHVHSSHEHRHYKKKHYKKKHYKKHYKKHHKRKYKKRHKRKHIKRF